MNSKNIKSVLKTQAKVIAYVVICLTVIVIGISYSIYSDVKSNSKNQVVTAGTLVFNYSGGTEIKGDDKADCFAQMTAEDAEKLTKCVYNVTVTNNGTLPGKFGLTLKQNDNISNHVELSKLKVILKQNGTAVNGYPKKVSDLSNGSLLSNISLNAKASTSYTIQVFADDSAITEDDDNKEISLKIEGVAEVNSDNINP